MAQIHCFESIVAGGAIAKTISRCLPTAVARVRFRIRSCGIYGGQSGTRAGFLQLLRFPLLLVYFTDCCTLSIIYHPELVQ
jgi:hypothetical protein